jgi:hypothetical protein
MGFVIHRKIVHSQSCTSLVATRKPNHSLMPAKFQPQNMAIEAEPSHAQHQLMDRATQHAYVDVVDTFHPAEQCESIVRKFLHCGTCM